MVHIYLAVRGPSKFPPLTTSTSVNNCYLARAKGEALHNIYSLLKKKKLETRAMLNGEGNARERCKITISLMSKKATLHVQHTFFLYISLLLCCTTTTWNFQKLLSYTFYGGNVVCSCFRSLFFTAAHFHLAWATCKMRSFYYYDQQNIFRFSLHILIW